MDVKVFSKDFRYLGIIDDYESLIFRRRWSDCGSFEFYAPPSAMKLFEIGNIIQVGNDPMKAGRIEHVMFSLSDEGQDVVAKGFSLLHMLSQRITVPPTGAAYDSYNAPAEDVMRGLVDANTAPGARALTRLNIPAGYSRGERIRYQTRYDNLLTALIEISLATGFGIAISFDSRERDMSFEVLEGTNRSTNQHERSSIVFSEGRENIFSRSYTDDILYFKNCAYVGGQGEGAGRAIHIEGNEFIGEDRYEMFVDARDLDSVSLLPDRAKVKLADYARSTSYEVLVDSRGYGVKWDLGDIVTVDDKTFNMTFDARITEIEEVYDENGVSITPTLGTPQKSIKQAILGNAATVE